MSCARKIEGFLILIFREGSVMTATTIAIEGSDGAGKATQTEMLVKYLKKLGYKVARVSFPRYKKTSAGKLLAEFLKSEKASEYDFANANPKLASLIYAEDRHSSRAHLGYLIRCNDFVIFDRYVESNLLHQGGKFRLEHEKADFARWLFDLEYGRFGLPHPDMVLYLDLHFTLSFGRALKRAREKGERLDAVESNAEYARNGWEAGRLYAKMFNWNIIPCVAPEESRESVAGRELTPKEIHLAIREVIGV